MKKLIKTQTITPPLRQLITAIEHADPFGLKTALDNGANPNDTSPYETLTAFTQKNSDTYAVEKKISALQYTIVKRNTFADTAMQNELLTKAMYLPLIEILLNHPTVNLHHQNSFNQSALLTAACYCDWEVIELLIKKGIDITCCDIVGNNFIGLTAMMPPSDKYEASYRAYINVPDHMLMAAHKETGSTPIHMLAEYDQCSMLKILLNRPTQEAIVNTNDFNENTPLCIATYFAHEQLANFLLTCGAKVIPHEKEPLKLLIFAVIAQSESLIRFFCSKITNCSELIQAIIPMTINLTEDFDFFNVFLLALCVGVIKGSQHTIPLNWLLSHPDVRRRIEEGNDDIERAILASIFSHWNEGDAYSNASRTAMLTMVLSRVPFSMHVLEQYVEKIAPYFTEAVSIRMVVDACQKKTSALTMLSLFQYPSFIDHHIHAKTITQTDFIELIAGMLLTMSPEQRSDIEQSTIELKPILLTLCEKEYLHLASITKIVKQCATLDIPLKRWVHQVYLACQRIEERLFQQKLSQFETVKPPPFTGKPPCTKKKNKKKKKNLAATAPTLTPDDELEQPPAPLLNNGLDINEDSERLKIDEASSLSPLSIMDTNTECSDTYTCSVDVVDRDSSLLQPMTHQAILTDLLQAIQNAGGFCFAYGGVPRALIQNNPRFNDIDLHCYGLSIEQLQTIIPNIKQNRFLRGPYYIGSFHRIKIDLLLDPALLESTPPSMPQIDKMAHALSRKKLTQDALLTCLIDQKLIIIDPCNQGINDIRQNVLQLIEPTTGLQDLSGNPALILRVFRFMAQGVIATDELQQTACRSIPMIQWAPHIGHILALLVKYHKAPYYREFYSIAFNARFFHALLDVKLPYQPLEHARIHALLNTLIKRLQPNTRYEALLTTLSLVFILPNRLTYEHIPMIQQTVLAMLLSQFSELIQLDEGLISDSVRLQCELILSTSKKPAYGFFDAMHGSAGSHQRSLSPSSSLFERP